MCYGIITIRTSEMENICKKLENREDVLGVVLQKKKNEDGTIEVMPLCMKINKHICKIVIELSREDLKRTIKRIRRIKGVLDTPKIIEQINVYLLGEQDSMDIQLGHRC